MSDAPKLVPVDPTDEMLETAHKEIRQCPDGAHPSPERLWRIMLAAAPSYEPGADREQLVVEISARMVVQVVEELRRLREDGDWPPRAKKAKASKTKYTCPSCDANAWAKPEAKLICGECDERMEEAA